MANRDARDRAVEVIIERKRKDRSVALLDGVASSVSIWRRIHLVATVLMFAVAAVDIVVALMFKLA